MARTMLQFCRTTNPRPRQLIAWLLVLGLWLWTVPPTGASEGQEASGSEAEGGQTVQPLDPPPDASHARDGVLKPGKRAIQRFSVDEASLLRIHVSGLRSSIKLVDEEGWLVGRGRSVGPQTQQLRTAVPKGTFALRLEEPAPRRIAFKLVVASTGTGHTAGTDNGGLVVSADGENGTAQSIDTGAAIQPALSDGGAVSQAGDNIGGGGGGSSAASSEPGGGAGAGGSSGGGGSGAGGRSGSAAASSGSSDAQGADGSDQGGGGSGVVIGGDNDGGSGATGGVGVVRAGQQAGQTELVTRDSSGDTGSSTETGDGGSVTTIAGGGSFSGSDEGRSGPAGIRRLVAWQNVGRTAKNEATRNVGRSMFDNGWTGFIQQRIKPALDWGVRRCMIHNPFGDTGGFPMAPDQYLEAKEAGLTWLTEDFVQAWRPVTSGQYTDGEPVEVIAYVGSFRSDKDFKRLLKQGKREAWFDRAMASLEPMLKAGMSIGLDAAAGSEADHPIVTLAGRLRARGHTVYIEALPRKGFTHWKNYPAIALSSFWDRGDVDERPFRRPSIELINGHARPDNSQGLGWLVKKTRSALDKGRHVALPIHWLIHRTDLSAEEVLHGRN